MRGKPGAVRQPDRALAMALRGAVEAMTEVLVIGAGPAGSAAAIQLARLGHEVLLLDRARFPRIKPCGEYYNPECVRLLRELGVLPDLLDAGARVLPGLSLGAAPCAPLSIPFSRVAPGCEPALSLGREVLDTILAGAAVSAGAAFREETLVREPLVENGRVCGAVVEAGGVRQEVRARLVLAADGLRSRFARRLGVAGPESRRRKLGLTARCTARPGAVDRIEMVAGHPGCCGLSLRGSEANLGMVADFAQAREVGGDPARFFHRALAGFPTLLADLDGGPREVRAVGPLTWRTRRQAVGGCLLLGDAAGFYDPFTGEGVTFALQTAQAAAEAAHAALWKNDLSTAGLREYESRRSRLLGPRVRLQQIIQAVIERPRLLRHILERLEGREDVARGLLSVIAGVTQPRGLLSARSLARLVL